MLPQHILGKPPDQVGIIIPKLTTTHRQYPGKEQPATTTCQDRTPELQTQSTGEDSLSGRGTRRLTREVLAGAVSVLTFLVIMYFQAGLDAKHQYALL